LQLLVVVFGRAYFLAYLDDRIKPDKQNKSAKKSGNYAQFFSHPAQRALLKYYRQILSLLPTD
jgi:hypothetical protein